MFRYLFGGNDKQTSPSQQELLNKSNNDEKPVKSNVNENNKQKSIKMPELESLNKMKDKRIILASNSPRRKEILATVGIEPEIIPSKFKENLSKDDFNHDPQAYPISTAIEKGKEVYERLTLEDDKNAPDLVISADTVVLIPDNVHSISSGQSYDQVIEQQKSGGQTYTICEKPQDENDHYRMLADANDRILQVVTGVCVTYPILQSPGYAQKSFGCQTFVHFNENSEEALWAYIKTDEGSDRAGGFAIQGIGSILIKGIEGDFNNVVGFPLSEFMKFIQTLIDNDEGFLDI